jgi:integrase
MARRGNLRRRKKTDVRTARPLLPQAQEIVREYQKPDAEATTPLLTFYSIQKFNSYQHEIDDLCSISKSITSYVARRTFAPTIALANGINLQTISKHLRNTTMKNTVQYAVVNRPAVRVGSAENQ